MSVKRPCRRGRRGSQTKGVRGETDSGAEEEAALGDRLVTRRGEGEVTAGGVFALIISLPIHISAEHLLYCPAHDVGRMRSYFIRLNSRILLRVIKAF